MTALNGKTKDWKLWVTAALLSILAGFMGIQWQTAIDAAASNEARLTQLIVVHDDDIEKMEADHDEDIARLDESNRNRRNQIADLEERIARLEERTGG